MLETITTFITNSFVNNQFAQGGLLIAAFGVIIALFRNVPYQLWTMFKAHFVVTAQIYNTDESFTWMNLWLANQTYTKRCRRLQVTSKAKISHSQYPNHQDDENPKDNRPNVLLIPSPGTHFFWYKGTFVIAEKTRSEQAAMQAKTGVSTINESMHLTIFSRRKEVLQEIVEEARNLAWPLDDKKVDIYLNDYNWYRIKRINKRPADSVVLPKGFCEHLLKDIRWFLDSSDWYTNIGIPYRRGYLFYGNPGNGKTSTATAIASDLNLSVYVVNLKDKSDSDLIDIFSKIPPHCILLIEDIDCIFSKRSKDEDLASKVTFGGLLNVLDGMVSSEGYILIMTTNHKDKLDPALIRPGRVDFQLEFKNADAYQGEMLIRRFYPTISDEDAKAFGLKAAGHSMAALQQHLMRYSPELAIEAEISDNLGIIPEKEGEEDGRVEEPSPAAA